MINLKTSNYKKIPAQFLLAGILIFSFIAVAGYKIGFSNSCPKATLTILSTDKKKDFLSTTGLYKVCLIPKIISVCASSLQQYYVLKALQMKQEIEIKFHFLVKEQFSFKKSDCFQQTYIFPRISFNDELPLSV